MYRKPLLLAMALVASLLGLVSSPTPTPTAATSATVERAAHIPA